MLRMALQASAVELSDSTPTSPTAAGALCWSSAVELPQQSVTRRKLKSANGIIFIVGCGKCWCKVGERASACADWMHGARPKLP